MPSFLFAEDVKQVIMEDEFKKHWVGTWINPELRGSDWEPQKLVCNIELTQDRYSIINQDFITCTHPYTDIDYWKDSEGNIWYKATAICALSPLPLKEMGRISPTNNTYEHLYYLGTETIEEWDPNNLKYIFLIYYRQE